MNRANAAELAVDVLRDRATEADAMVTQQLANATAYPPGNPERLACLNLAFTFEYIRRHYAEAADVLAVQP